MRRRTVVLLLLAFFVVLIVTYKKQDVSGSTFSSTPNGARGLFLLLESQKVNVERWFHPLRDLKDDSMMFLINPGSLSDYDELLAWVRRGNDLVYIFEPSDAAHKFRKQLGISGDWADLEDAPFLNEETPGVPLRCPEHSTDPAVNKICDGVSVVTRPSLFSFKPPNKSLVLVGDETSASIFVIPFGQGKVWVFSGTNSVANRYLDRNDNLRFAYQLATSRKSTYFDEFHHGYTAPPSTERRRMQWRLVYAFISLLVVVLAIGALSRSVRFGPPRPIHPDDTSASVDFVSVLGLLYREKGARDVLSNYAKALRTRIEHRHRISRKLPHGQAISEMVEKGIIQPPDATKLERVLDDLTRGKIQDDNHIPISSNWPSL